MLAEAPDSETLSITADVSNADQEEYDAAMLDKVLDIDLKGVLYGMKHTLPHLKA